MNFAENSSMKFRLINTVLEKVDMKNINSETKEKRNSCIVGDNNDLKKLKGAITSTINPFKKDIDKSKLFNIKTELRATEETEKYLLSIVNNGKVKRNSFINECTEDETRFSKPIKKTKIINFAISNVQKKKTKSQNVSKIASIWGTRGIFGRLLYLAVTNEINLEKIFEYPILSEPTYFTHPDGTVRWTDKAAIHHYIVKDQNFNHQCFYQNLVSWKPCTLSAIAKLILQKALCLTNHQADLCFDVYTSPSIKYAKQRTRGKVNSELTFLFGPYTKTPKDVFDLLKINDFKKELLRFFITEYPNDEYAVILGNKVLHCSVDNECKKSSTK